MCGPLMTSGKSDNTFAVSELVKLSLRPTSFIQLSAPSSGWPAEFWPRARDGVANPLIERSLFGKQYFVSDGVGINNTLSTS